MKENQTKKSFSEKAEKSVDHEMTKFVETANKKLLPSNGSKWQKK